MEMPRMVTRPGDLTAVMHAEAAGKPFLRFRDAEGCQRLEQLPEHDAAVLVIGRRPECHLPLPWDTRVSRQHARLELFPSGWTVVDDGLARNGTFLNGDRIDGRRSLSDADVLLIGRTHIQFRNPVGHQSMLTSFGGIVPAAPVLTPAQLRVLNELCRPALERRHYATPASTPEIAASLHLSADAVKTHMRALFHAFDVPDLPQNQKRARLVELALLTGTVRERGTQG